LNALLGTALRDRAIIRVQGPISIGPHSEPQPDLALFRPPLARYAESHPGPEDLFLVIEVAETTADDDRARKIPLYARSGIREVKTNSASMSPKAKARRGPARQ
jgi:Uma2 family endonuclease